MGLAKLFSFIPFITLFFNIIKTLVGYLLNITFIYGRYYIWQILLWFKGYGLYLCKINISPDREMNECSFSCLPPTTPTRTELGYRYSTSTDSFMHDSIKWDVLLSNVEWNFNICWKYLWLEYCCLDMVEWNLFITLYDMIWYDKSGYRSDYERHSIPSEEKWPCYYRQW